MKFLLLLMIESWLVSLPVRGAWVEIPGHPLAQGSLQVAPRAGSVG